MIRTVPSNGLVVAAKDKNLNKVLDMGCWTPLQSFSVMEGEGADWQVKLLSSDGGAFAVYFEGQQVGEVCWEATGMHNVANGLAAIAAARHVGVTPEQASTALCSFRGVKRRMEVLASTGGVTVYDDFAHHPTAIASTLQGLRKKVGGEKILAVIEPRSNTMKMGVHNAALMAATGEADQVLWFQPDTLDWSIDSLVDSSPVPAKVMSSIDALVKSTLEAIQNGGHIVVMSNGGFSGFHGRLVKALEEQNG